jgi:acyl-CoA reductase-like NAD-dependent aldehyde dehydrogenase
MVWTPGADWSSTQPYALAALETTDMGKPVTQCRERDLPHSVANFRFFADYPRFCEDEANCYFVRDLRAPFGGFKDSGIGRKGGKHSREFFTEVKTVVMEM